MQACIKSYAAREVSEDTYEFIPIEWVHPREVNDDELMDIMRDVYEFSKDTTTSHDWITVVAYDMSWNAFVACDYERRHPSSEDRYYGNDIADEIARLRV